MDSHMFASSARSTGASPARVIPTIPHTIISILFWRPCDPHAFPYKGDTRPKQKSDKTRALGIFAGKLYQRFPETPNTPLLAWTQKPELAQPGGVENGEHTRFQGSGKEN